MKEYKEMTRMELFAEYKRQLARYGEAWNAKPHYTQTAAERAIGDDVNARVKWLKRKARIGFNGQLLR